VIAQRIDARPQPRKVAKKHVPLRAQQRTRVASHRVAASHHCSDRRLETSVIVQGVAKELQPKRIGGGDRSAPTADRSDSGCNQRFRQA
jgi:hypothetical protein